MLRSSYESGLKQLRKCSGAVTKVFRSSYESVPEQLVSLPEHLNKSSVALINLM